MFAKVPEEVPPLLYASASAAGTIKLFLWQRQKHVKSVKGRLLIFLRKKCLASRIAWSHF